MLKIGVKVPNIDAMKTLKKEILFFDKIIIDEELYLKNLESLELLSLVAGLNLSQQISYWNSNLEYLEKKGAIEFLNFSNFLAKAQGKLSKNELELLKKSVPFNDGIVDIKKSMDELGELIKSGEQPSSIKEIQSTLKRVLKYQFINEEMRPQIYSEVANLVSSNKIFTPIFFEFPKTISQEKKKSFNAVSFILKKIPLPSEETSFERILDFKKDGNSMLKLQRLRKFTNELNITPDNYKIKEEEYIYLLNEYTNHISNLDIKFNESKIQIVVVQGLKLIEDLVKFKWSEIAKSVFDIKKHKVDYMITESKAPGKELAYIHKIDSDLT